MDLTEAEDIKRWQEYMEELYKKDLHDPDNHDAVITHLEPDILECEVKWAQEASLPTKLVAIALNVYINHINQTSKVQLPPIADTDSVLSISWILGPKIWPAFSRFRFNL